VVCFQNIEVSASQPAGLAARALTGENGHHLIERRFPSSGIVAAHKSTRGGEMDLSALTGGLESRRYVVRSGELRRPAAQAGWLALAVVVLALLAGMLATASASAAPLVWSGNAAEHHWSAVRNWERELAPTMSEPSELEFPHLSGCSGSCYTSENDLSGLKVESIKIDDGDEYELSGDEIDLGSGGMTISPAAGTSGRAGDLLELPIHLSASQSWSLTGRSGGAVGENGAAVVGNLSGSSSALTVGIGNEALLVMGSEAEVGPVALEGANAGKAGVLNGAVELFGDVNFSDGNAVDLNHMFLIGSGALGALHTDQGELDVGVPIKPAEGVLADSATFDAASEVGFRIVGEGSAAGEDYSQLESVGDVELNGAKLAVRVSPPSSKSNVCPTLRPGQTYTLISTQGPLSGTFSNAPEGGAEIQISFAKVCTQPTQTMRIAYHRSGAVRTVTGTIEAQVAERQEKERAEQEQHEHEEARRRQEAGEREQNGIKEMMEASAKAAARAAEETAKREAEARKHQEEEATQRIEQEERASSPTLESVATLAGSTLSERGRRQALVKLICRGPGTCAGKLLLKSKGGRSKQIGAANFSIAAYRTVTVAIPLDAAGRALLRAGRDRIDAELTIESHGGSSQHAKVRLRPGR
jgi:hypothetical protein